MKKILIHLLKPLSFLPAILMMYLIYSFSAQTGEVSGALSYEVSYQIVETKNIIKTADGAAALQADGSQIAIPLDTHVSMNMWGLTPDFIDYLQDGFTEFLRALPADDLTSEYLLPTIIDDLIQKDQAMVTLLPTNDKWFGVTYKEDKEAVIQAIKELIAKGLY